MRFNSSEKQIDKTKNLRKKEFLLAQVQDNLYNYQIYIKTVSHDIPRRQKEREHLDKALA
jgi:hypothetical protein